MIYCQNNLKTYQILAFKMDVENDEEGHDVNYNIHVNKKKWCKFTHCRN